MTRLYRYGFALLPTLVVVAGNLIGGMATVGNMVFTLILMVVVDFLVPADPSPNFDSESGIPDGWLIVGSIAHWISVLSLFAGLVVGRFSGQQAVWAAISTGLNSGLVGITSAHELIHRKSPVYQWIGIFSLSLCFYSHFFIEHRFGHHARVGTPHDPATARRGESFYAFLLRTLPGQWISAWKLEADRLKRIGRQPWGPGNFVLTGTSCQIVFLLFLGFSFGADTALVIALQAFIGVFLLEYVNYIEHYGLVREKGEPVLAHHAWQSDSATSRFTLYELSRHSHHHMDARVPYDALQSLPGQRRLPFGYYGMFYIALIPPLWFYLMDSKLDSAG